MWPSNIQPIPSSSDFYANFQDNLLFIFNSFHVMWSKRQTV